MDWARLPRNGCLLTFSSRELEAPRTLAALPTIMPPSPPLTPRQPKPDGWPGEAVVVLHEFQDHVAGLVLEGEDGVVAVDEVLETMLAVALAPTDGVDAIGV